MKLGPKIILPLLLLLVIILGALGYILLTLKQQEAVISTQQFKVRTLNRLNERLALDQEKTDFNVLSYRFNQDKSFLLSIERASLDKSKALDEMYPFIDASQGRELVASYIDAKKGTATLRSELLRAIDDGNDEKISLAYSKWDIQTQYDKATLADLRAYNINLLEESLLTVGEIRDKIVDAIIYI